MRNLKVTAMVASALVGGLVLGSIGIAAATTLGQATPGTNPAPYGSMETTTPVTPPSTDTTDVVTPPSTDTTIIVTPPSTDTTESVSTTDTPRPPMPAQAKGHAYGRMIVHMHSGLHRGWTVKPSAMHKTRHMGMTNRSTTAAVRTEANHMSGSMMNR